MKSYFCSLDSLYDRFLITIKTNQYYHSLPINLVFLMRDLVHTYLVYLLYYILGTVLQKSKGLQHT